MLPCVCSVIDHRRRQNVVRTSVAHSAIASCATFLFSPHFDVICDLLLNRRTATWNLFVLYNNEEKALSISKCFNICSKAGLCGASAQWWTRKKAIWRSLLSIQNEAISLVAMRSKELWLVQENHATVTLDLSVASRGMKTYSESRIERRNLQIFRKYWTSQVSFYHQCSPVSRKAWTLPGKLQGLN